MELIDSLANTMVVYLFFFAGEIPEEIGNLLSLEILKLGGIVGLPGQTPPINQLTGHIPKSIGNLTMLKELDISANRLEGRLLTLIFLPEFKKKNLLSLFLFFRSILVLCIG